MRITRDLLVRLAKENAEERAFNNKNIISAYLTGSALQEKPLLGGTTDIDLVFVHQNKPEIKRELKTLSPDIHLDIHHRAEEDYLPPRELRDNPWLGSELYDPMQLYETKHFFEFTQASLRAGFDEPKHQLKRSYSLLNTARKTWLDLQFDDSPVNTAILQRYLDALYNAANAIVILDGAPLTERRFLLDFPARTKRVGHPELTAGLFGLLGSNEISPAVIAEWLPEWTSFFAFAAEATGTDIRIHNARQAYYSRAIEAILQGETPLAALYPLLLTWTLAASVLPENQLDAWADAITQLGLDTASFEDRLAGLDQYLDQIEEILEKRLFSYGFEPDEIL